VTVAAVRPLPRAADDEGWRAPQPESDAPAEPAQSGPFEIGSPYRAGAIVAGRYRLAQRLGRGGMGEVWSAHHVTLRTEVAVKFPSLAGRGRAATMALERFRFEAQIAARLGRETRHVAAVHDAGCDSAGPYLVMEYVRGRTLQQEIDDRVVLPLPRVAAIVAQVAEALAVAHGYGVVHRDLKPSNLLLAAEAGGSLLVKVADFGIAKALRVDLGADLPEDTTGGFMIGSPPYMSPEQIGGGAASAGGDRWSLAVIAYEAITGRLPFAGRSFAELLQSLVAGRFDLPSAVRPGLPTSVDAWFRCALCKEEARRFSTAREMADALQRAVAAPPRPPSRWKAQAAQGLRFLTGLFAAPLPPEDPARGPRGLGSIERRAPPRDLG
jgi:eukaryotic-like serine/threonine-protein kinase